MSELIFRTEELTNNQINELYVASEYEQGIVDKLKAPSPVLLVGSRGVGKSFLFRVSEIQMLQEFPDKKVLPVFLTFRKASLLKTTNPEQFQNWMLSRICSEVLRCLKKVGKLSPISSGLSLLAGEKYEESNKINEIAKAFEESWRNPGECVDVSSIPTVDEFLNTIEDLCEDLDISRIVLFIDEAAHVFLPQQQREFFTLFRDLRSPYIKCNAAVYPGVTVYGETFEPVHDAVTISLVRNVNDPNYISIMKQMVLKQIHNSNLAANLSRRGENFTLLAYASSGNPRYLLTSISMAEKMDSSAVNQVFRSYYREKLLAEHTKLSERFPGYKDFISWGRDFLETIVIPELKRKNDSFIEEKNSKGTTAYFWIHNNAPHEVKEALRILEYSGLIYEDAAAIRATRSEVGTRYMVNLGCLLAAEATPTATGLKIITASDVRRMSEYGANYPSFQSIQGKIVGTETDILKEQLNKSIDLLDLTDWQKQKMHEIAINTIGELISAPENKLKQAKYIANVRSRTIKNAGIAAGCEYLLG